MRSKKATLGWWSGSPQFEAFPIWRSVEKWDLRNIVGSQKTHKSRSTSQSKGKHEWHQKHNTLMEEVVPNNLKHFVCEDLWKMRFQRIVSSKKTHKSKSISHKVEGNAYEIKSTTRWRSRYEPAIWNISYMNILLPPEVKVQRDCRLGCYLFV